MWKRIFLLITLFTGISNSHTVKPNPNPNPKQNKPSDMRPKHSSQSPFYEYIEASLQ